MSHHEFDPKCPDCRPAIIDPATGQVLPPTHPNIDNEDDEA